MEKGWYDKFRLLPYEDKRNYCIRLDEILNNNLFSSLLPKEEIEVTEERLYERMFNLKTQINDSINNFTFLN
jgi:hypothetical protein